MPNNDTTNHVPFPSLAHEQSAPFIIDPSYSATELAPPPSDTCDGAWMYGDGELECCRLAVLRKRAQDAKLKVYYPGTFHTPSCRGLFRLNDPSRLPKNLAFRTNGRVVVKCNDKVIHMSDSNFHSVALAEVGRFVIEITTRADNPMVEPPCLWIPGESPLAKSQSWQWSSDGKEWAYTQSFSSIEGCTCPHLVEAPEIRVSPKKKVVDGVYDFGCELLGRVTVSCEHHEQTPKIYVGESLAEALNDDPEHFEQSTELVPVDQMNGTWQSLHLLAFQYVRVVGCDGLIEIACDAQFHPVQYRGAFASSDEMLTRIWMNSAYTLRLCMHDFLVDGIKRDRLPWAGDLAVSLLANAYTFTDTEIIRRSLTVLGRAGIAETDVCGIVDYSLWWIICHDLFQLYFGDREHLEREWNRIIAALVCLISRCSGETGFIRVDEKYRWVFIDWVEDVEKTTALQILWWWALVCGLRLAQWLNDQSIIEILEMQQVKVKTSLVSSCWDDAAGLWRSAPEAFSRHANVLAIVSRLTGDGTPQITDALLKTDLLAMGTPYMKTFECLALSSLGVNQSGARVLRSYWGSMTEKGATTYFEAFNESEDEENIPSFYDRPFGRSLCHAWSSGPSFLLPEMILGIRPLADGWAAWACNPNLGGLEWISSTIPTPRGCIEVEATSESIRISVPGGTTLIQDGTSYPGPDVVTKSISKATDTIDAKTIKEWSGQYRGWHYHLDHVIPPNPNVSGYEDVYMTDVPTVYQLPDDDDCKWYMSFVGFNGKGYQSFVAESSDLVKWGSIRLAMGFGEEGEFDYGGRVIGAFLYEDYNIKANRVLKKKDGKYWSLYGAYSKQGKYEIDPGYEGLASSDDGLIWTRAKEQYILSVYDDDLQDWEQDSIYQPWLVEHGGRYYNFYNAKRMPEWVEQIGLATSTDMFRWKRDKENPVLRVRPDCYDAEFVADGKVFKDGDHWTMFYFGVGKGGAHIMVAFSRDLINWIADPEPLYKAGGNPSGLDSQYAHKISLVWNSRNETWCMYYDAVGVKGRGIGLITSRPL